MSETPLPPSYNLFRNRVLQHDEGCPHPEELCAERGATYPLAGLPDVGKRDRAGLCAV